MVSTPPSLPPDWTWRVVRVPGQAVRFKVPAYIVRIDIDRGGGKDTHGWQVRYPKGCSKLFSDAKHDTRRRLGTPRDSLRAAQAYLATIWKGVLPAALPRESQRKAIATGMPGVRVTRRLRGAQVHWYVRVDDLRGKPLASIYLGTDNTVTFVRVDAALIRALALRRAYLEQEGREVPSL